MNINKLADFFNSKMLKYRTKRHLVNIIGLFLGSEKRKKLRRLLTDNYDELFAASKGIFFNVKTFNDLIKMQENHHLHDASTRYFIENTLNRIAIKKDYVFLDAGCGTGYVLWKASSRFSKVVGIEYMSELADMAKVNLKKLKVKNATVINDDICNLKLRGEMDSINVVYMYNPFSGKIMETFIADIVASIYRKDRDVYIIYINDVCKDILKKYEAILPLKELIEDKNWRDSRIYYHKKGQINEQAADKFNSF